MAQVVLKPPRVHPLVRQGVVASMAEHVDVDRKPDPSFGASPFNHPGNAHSPKGCTTFVDEDISRLIRETHHRISPKKWQNIRLSSDVTRTYLKIV